MKMVAGFCYLNIFSVNAHNQTIDTYLPDRIFYSESTPHHPAEHNNQLKRWPNNDSAEISEL